MGSSIWLFSCLPQLPFVSTLKYHKVRELVVCLLLWQFRFLYVWALLWNYDPITPRSSIVLRKDGFSMNHKIITSQKLRRWKDTVWHYEQVKHILSTLRWSFYDKMFQRNLSVITSNKTIWTVVLLKSIIWVFMLHILLWSRCWIMMHRHFKDNICWSEM